MAKRRNFNVHPDTKLELQDEADLPSKRAGKATTRTAAPLYHTSFASFIYGLAFIILLIIGFYLLPFGH
jgi:hypothetical protein